MDYTSDSNQPICSIISLVAYRMATKPYSPSHIGAVASNFATLRISGDVKSTLSELLCEVDTLVPQMEKRH